jgi:glutamyl-tRNA reductase
MFLIDLGVPRNFDELLNSLENVYLYDIDDLGKVALESRDEREREALRAEPLVELEVDSFMRWLEGLELVPAIKDIRFSIEQLRADELERHRAWLAGLTPDERTRIESMTRSLVNKLLHRVLSGLRDSHNAAAEGAYAAAMARRLLCSGLDLDDHDVPSNAASDAFSEALNEVGGRNIREQGSARVRRK